MNWISEKLSKGADRTVGRRLIQYERRERIILWLGGGLAAIVALFTAIEFTRESELPVEILPVVPVAVVFGGACLGKSRIDFEWAAETLRREIEDGTLKKGDDLAGDALKWPVVGELFYLLELYVTVGAGGWIVVMAIWSAILGPAPTELPVPTITPTASA